MTRVLILTASYGSGHNAAARSLAAAFEREQTAVTVVDHFRELVHPLFDRASRTLYHGLLRRAPLLWGVGYSLGAWVARASFPPLRGARLGTNRRAPLLDRPSPPTRPRRALPWDSRLRYRSSSRWPARRAGSAVFPTSPASFARCAGRCKGSSSPATTRASGQRSRA